MTITVNPAQIEDARNQGNKLQALISSAVNDINTKIATLGEDTQGETMNVTIEFRDRFVELRSRVDDTQTQLSNLLGQYTENMVGLDRATAGKMHY